MPSQSDPQFVEVGGRTMRVSSLAKVFFPDDGITKAEILRYYLEWAELMLPHLRDRPVTIKAWPHGVMGRPYYRRHVPESAPEWLSRVPSKDYVTPYIGNEADLMWVVNQDSVEIHPWLSRADEIETPDQTVFDLDPGPSVTLERLCEAAMIVKEALERMGMRGWPKTSGSKGFHVLVGLKRRYSFDEVRAWTQAVAQALTQYRPDLFLSGYNKRDRENRVLVDYNQVGYGRTTAGIYSVRPLPGAPVSAPVTWEEIEAVAVGPTTFNLGNIDARLKEVGDIAADLPGDELELGLLS